jgi:uncharacterized membrane protein YedE/YeeE
MHEYLQALIGGLMIGLAAVIIMASHGKIMGVSGIVSGLLPRAAVDRSWRLWFIAGILAAPILLALFVGHQPSVELTDNLPMLISGGLLVGLGTVIGNGCTSGHGVCGLGRLSKRSLVATATFMGTAIVTVYFSRHLLGG